VEVISRLTIPLSFYSSIENSFVGVYSRLPKTKSKISLWAYSYEPKSNQNSAKKKKKKNVGQEPKSSQNSQIFFFVNDPAYPFPKTKTQQNSENIFEGSI
jgi:hypothetical protein